jgi:hypothetical protein
VTDDFKMAQGALRRSRDADRHNRKQNRRLVSHRADRIERRRGHASHRAEPRGALRPLFWLFEHFSVAVFTIEYVLRMWLCTENASYRHPLSGRIKYFFTPFAIIDLIAIAPFYLPMLIPVDLIFLRALRLVRLLRLLKLGRYSESIKLMGSVLKSKKEEISVAIAMSLILLIIASGLMCIP